MCTNSGLPPTSEHAAFLIHQKDEACSALFEACFPTPVDRPNFLTRLGNKAFFALAKATASDAVGGCDARDHRDHGGQTGRA